MKKGAQTYPLVLTLALAAVLAAPAFAQEKPLASQTTISELVSLTGEVVAIDQAGRQVTLRGPLGGEITGRVSDDVKNLAQVKVGDMLTIGYYSSIAVSATKKGEANPLFTGGDSATAAPGEQPAAYASKQVKRTVTVAAVDPASRSLVLQGEGGVLFPVTVRRPEFVQKLKTLRVGDQLDVVVTEAVIAAVTPAAPGEKPSLSREVGTLIVDRVEVVQRISNTLILRNEQGRSFKLTVDPEFTFMLDGKASTVADIKPGTRLKRTAFRVVEAESLAGQ